MSCTDALSLNCLRCAWRLSKNLKTVGLFLIDLLFKVTLSPLDAFREVFVQEELQLRNGYVGYGGKQNFPVDSFLLP